MEENVKYLEIKVTDLEEHNQLLQQNLTLKTNENSRIKNKLSEVSSIYNLYYIIKNKFFFRFIDRENYR